MKSTELHRDADGRPAPLRLLVLRPPGQSAVFHVTPERLAAAFARAGVEMREITVETRPDGDPAIADALVRADVLIGADVPTRLLGAARHLGLIQLSSAGIDHLLPLDWLPRHVALTTAKGVHGAKLREWAMMVFLMLHNQIPHFVTAQRRHGWERKLAPSVAGRRALIFGTGGIGRAIAAGAGQLGIEAVGVGRRGGPAAGFDAVLSPAEAETALGTADFVVLALPLTPATRGIADARFFGRMAPGAGFANFGRGDLVDQEALIAALDGGRLGGAVIDVTTPEPLPAGAALWDAPRLIVTPHVSADDPAGHVDRMLDILVENLRRRAAGLPLLNEVDRSHGY
ncbi:D-2-hydroxyacid dehydrogenase [Zavarzinia sp.]|uniref:D-2-hydroxyacid dehydrogenase n=1 Tax=Zavarzinia sp. TaxID=2027920 RepID=UPI003561D5B0